MRPPRSKAEFWMVKAIQIAANAELNGDRPFAAIVVNGRDERISMASGTGNSCDPLRHCECEAIKKACAWYGDILEGHTLYSTHEPCHMCAGAILHAHLGCVVWGSYRMDLPQLFRAYDVPTEVILRDSSHPPLIVGGVLREACKRLFNKELNISDRNAGACQAFRSS